MPVRGGQEQFEGDRVRMIGIAAGTRLPGEGFRTYRTPVDGTAVAGQAFGAPAARTTGLPGRGPEKNGE